MLCIPSSFVSDRSVDGSMCRSQILDPQKQKGKTATFAANLWSSYILSQSSGQRFVCVCNWGCAGPLQAIKYQTGVGGVPPNQGMANHLENDWPWTSRRKLKPCQNMTLDKRDHLWNGIRRQSPALEWGSASDTKSITLILWLFYFLTIPCFLTLNTKQYQISPALSVFKSIRVLNFFWMPSHNASNNPAPMMIT